MSDEAAGSRSEDAMALEVGRAFLNAHRIAEDIVGEAHRKAAAILAAQAGVGPSAAGTPAAGRLPAQSTGTDIANRSAAHSVEILDQLDRLERALADRQAAMLELLDSYLVALAADEEATSPALAPDQLSTPDPLPRIDLATDPSDPYVANDSPPPRSVDVMIDPAPGLTTSSLAAAPTAAGDILLASNEGTVRPASEGSALATTGDTALATAADMATATGDTALAMTEGTDVARIAGTAVVSPPTAVAGSAARSSNARLNVIACVVALAVLSVLLVLVNTL